GIRDRNVTGVQTCALPIFTEKQAQHDDLAKSRHDLLEIINKINTDSKKLFTETFAMIRGHFQDLFRKLFGGGMADVLLEDESDRSEERRVGKEGESRGRPR